METLQIDVTKTLYNKNVSIEIVDMSGRIVTKIFLVASKKTHNIHLGHLKRGMYAVRISTVNLVDAFMVAKN
jgi:hypothetical protein